MSNFLKKFFTGEKKAEEQNPPKKHDVLKLALPADTEEEQEDCSTPTGCCGGGCH